jgi:hypothetical protein
LKKVSNLFVEMNAKIAREGVSIFLYGIAGEGIGTIQNKKNV